MQYEFNPITITKVNTINKFNISSIIVDLFNSVTITLFLYDNDNKMVDVKTLKMTTEEYQQWGNDDNYIIEYVKNKLISSIN